MENSVENSLKFAPKNTLYSVRKECGNSAEISRKVSDKCLQRSLPERHVQCTQLGASTGVLQEGLRGPEKS